jgi:hypothetical protein
MNTGPRSLMNRIHGGIQALIEQSHEPITKEKMKRRIKDIAALENEYPSVEKRIKIKRKDGTVKVITYLEPESLADESTENGMKIYMTIQEIADAYELYLIEYADDDTPYRTVAGRPPDEMKKYIEELRAKGETEKARILSQVPRWTGRSWVFEDPAEKTPEAIIESTFKGEKQ